MNDKDFIMQHFPPDIRDIETLVQNKPAMRLEVPMNSTELLLHKAIMLDEEVDNWVDAQVCSTGRPRDIVVNMALRKLMVDAPQEEAAIKPVFWNMP